MALEETSTRSSVSFHLLICLIRNVLWDTPPPPAPNPTPPRSLHRHTPIKVFLSVDLSQTFSQSLQSDSLFQSTDNGSSQMSQNVLNQNVSDSTISQFEMPPQIPMPPGQVRNVWMTKQVIIRWKSPQFYTYAYLYFNVQISRVKM